MRTLLQELGIALLLDRDSDGRVLEPEAHYEYRPAAGPVLVASDTPCGGPRLRGASLIAFGRDDLYDASVLKDCKQLTRWVVDHHLDGRPLRSRELLRAIARGGSSYERREMK